MSNNPVNFRDPDGLTEVFTSPGDAARFAQLLGIGILIGVCKNCVDPLAEEVDALGIRDTLEHCFVGGKARNKCGLFCAETAAVGKEVLDYFGDGTAEFRDIQNTFEGFKCADVSNCNSELENCCENQNLTENP